MVNRIVSQRGSTRVVIVGILVAALIGAGGVFLWWSSEDRGGTTDDNMTSTNNTSASKLKGDEDKKTPSVINEATYSFIVPAGFQEVAEQQFTYTASLKAEKTFINASGDYFEILLPTGGGGGISSDYSWHYNIQNHGQLSVTKSEACEEGYTGCTSSNNTVEGIISSRDTNNRYVLAFGNKTKNKTDLTFVDQFLSTLQLN